ncbi:MAG: hypothetical protein MUO76_10580 [Anaerolineaceae bacterium]|nr:hypothetical protein [Anaerolineaceae bacterium]
MNKNVVMRFLSLILLVGVMTTAWIFGTPSETSSAVFLGLSSLRLLLALLNLILLSFIGGVYLICLISPHRLEKLLKDLDKQLLEQSRLVPLSLTLAYFSLIGSVGLILIVSISQNNYPFYMQKMGAHFPTLHAYAKHALPMLVFFVSTIAILLILFITQYAGQYKDKRLWHRGDILKTALVLVISSATLLHWLILTLRLELLYHIPGWSWWIDVKPFTIRDTAFAVLLLMMVTTAYLVQKKPQAVLRNLTLVLFIGYAAQLSLGIVVGEGVESLRQRYYTSDHSIYAHLATRNELSLLDTVRQYESLYGNTLSFQSTKPPGVMLIHIELERLINHPSAQVDDQARFHNLSRAIAWIFPFVSLLTLFMIYIFVRWVANGQPDTAASLIAALLYTSAANVISLALFMDQVIYPWLFLSIAGLIVLSFRRQSILLGFLTGCALYIALFFSFAVMPIFAFSGIYALIDWWLNRNERSWRHQVTILLAFGGGILLLFLILYFMLNYDFISRLQWSLKVVRSYDYYQRLGLTPEESVSLITRIRQTIAAAFLNNIDFAVGIGLPLFSLYLVRVGKTLQAFIQKRATHAEGVLGALFGTFVALNIYAPIHGEAARLWLYWVPMVAIFAGIEITCLAKRKPWVLYLLLATQVVTLVLTFHFQDIRMW